MENQIGLCGERKGKWEHMLTSDQFPSAVWVCITGIEFVPDGKFTLQEWKGSPAMKRQDDTPMYLEGTQKKISINQ